jgi:hypothetical protein
MTTRALVVTAVLVATTAASTLAQTPAPTPQPGQPAPRARGSVPPAEPRMAIPPGEARATTPAAAPAAPERPRAQFQPVNVKVDLTLTDQRGGATPIKRTVTVLAADGYTGSIRTQSEVVGVGGGVPLNVDASPTLLADGKIRLGINLQYGFPAPVEQNATRGSVTSTSLHDQLMMIMENGKPMIVAQSADPIGDRQVTVEVKATVLR